MASGKPQTRMTDITIGSGSHGMLCCPHIIMGVWVVTSASKHMTNNLKTIRYVDLYMHNCPHCPMGMGISFTTKKTIENILSHRLGDTTTEFCGAGQTVQGSTNTLIG